MGIHSYFTNLSKLERIYRFPGEFVFERHNVASHSFKVAQIAQFLGEIEASHGVQIDWKTLYEKAINHDVGEIFVGDIKTPVKYWSPELREMIAHVEENMIQTFIEQEFPEEFQEMFAEKFKEGKDDSVEGKILAVSDKIDQLYECFEELQRGNHGEIIIEAYKQALIKIKEVPLHSVDYFLDFVLPDMLNDKINSIIDIRKITEEILNA